MIGEGWPVNKRPNWSTIIHRTASGKQIRIPNQSQELLKFELPYNYLGSADLQAMYGFYCAHLGPWDTFLFDDVTDNNTIANATIAGLTPATAQNVIGTGDGSTKTFQLSRSLGGSTRSVFDINGGSGMPAFDPPTPVIAVYFGTGGSASLQSGSSYSLSSTGVITFVSAPGNGIQIAADFSYFWRCHFADDSLDLSNFAQSFWESKKILLEHVAV